MSESISHTACDSCGSSDAGQIYEDGQFHCHKCQHHVFADESVTKSEIVRDKASDIEFVTGKYESLRGIHADTCKLFQYSHGYYNGKRCSIGNVLDKEGALVAQKIRLPGKEFPWIGDNKKGTLFGQHRFGKGKRIAITEGFEDAMALSEVLGNSWAVVSIINGADVKGTGPRKEVTRQLEYLSNFEHIVIMFDMDEPGKTSALEVAKCLPMGKVSIASLSEHDACDMLKAGKAAELRAAFWNAKPYRPDGIVSIEERIRRIHEPVEISEFLYPFPKLNEMTKGLWKKHITLICAGSGVGKSSLIREMCLKFIQEEHKVGYIALEEDSADIDIAMIELLNNRIMSTEVDWQKVNANLISNYEHSLMKNISIYDDHGSMTTERMQSTIDYMVQADGCEIIIIDHISMLSLPESADAQERLVIDQNMTLLRKLAQRHKIAIVVISHLNRPKAAKSFEEGAEVRNNHLRGSGTLSQIPNTIIALEGDIYDNMNNRKLHVNKCRKRGTKVGYADSLHYDQISGRMSVINDKVNIGEF